MTIANSIRRSLTALVLVAMWLGVFPGAARGAVDPFVASAAVDTGPLVRGGRARIGVKIVVNPAYHIQSATPHDKFLIPTTVALKDVSGITAGVAKFPVASEIEGPPGTIGTLSVYEETVYILLPIAVAADAPLGDTTLELSVRAQACDETACLPPKTKKLQIPVTIAAAGTANSAKDAEFFAAADQQPYAESAPAATAPAPATASAVQPSAEMTQPSPGAGGGTSVDLLSTDAQLAAIKERAYKPYNREEQNYSLGFIILFALIGGAILNVMPCVLPVIPLKVLSLVQQAHGDRKLAVLHSLAFSAGVISLFVVLAVALKIFGLFYGQQFQSPAFLVAMVMFVVALALSMLGVWTINPPQAIYNVDTQHAGYLGSFTNGLMATLLATPCSAPYLGPVLAWALIQPALITALALGLVGVGMSLPYLLLAAFPAALEKLPRAGRWTELLKQGLGIVMIGVAVYLITLIPNVTYWPWVLLGTVLLGLVCWAWGQIPTPSMELGTVWTIRVVVLVIGILLGAGLWSLASRSAPTEVPTHAGGETAVIPEKPTTQWMPFNVALLDAALKEGRPVVVDWTADWCINCRTLDTFVLSTDVVQQGFLNNRAVLLRADLSSDNPPATALNSKLGGQAIPVLAIFSPSRPLEPVVLRDKYSRERVVTELRAAR